MRSRRRKRENEWNLSLVDFVARERPDDLTVVERVYRNVAYHGQLCERLTLGHKEVYFRDARGRYCYAAFTPRCSIVRRDPPPGCGWWHEAVERSVENTVAPGDDSRDA